MFTQICTLTFADGATVTARIEAASPHAREPIEYSGAVERLPRRHEQGDPAMLRAFFENLAEELPAEYSESGEGDYERWAE